MKAVEREKINRASNSIVRQINSYKVSLPDIYLRPLSKAEGEGSIMVTNFEENYNSRLKYSRQHSSRATVFLRNVQNEEKHRKEEGARIKEYHQQIR